MAFHYLSTITSKQGRPKNGISACSQFETRLPQHHFTLDDIKVDEYDCGCARYSKKGSPEPLTISCKLHNVRWPRSSQLPRPLSASSPKQAARWREKLHNQPSMVGRPHSDSDPTHLEASIGAFLAKADGLPCKLYHFNVNFTALIIPGFYSHCQPQWPRSTASSKSQASRYRTGPCLQRPRLRASTHPGVQIYPE